MSWFVTFNTNYLQALKTNNKCVGEKYSKLHEGMKYICIYTNRSIRHITSY